MARVAVVVNGIPGSGKTTLAGPLGSYLQLPVLSKDVFKEGLADLVTVPLPKRSIGGLAADVVWTIAGMIDGPVIVESFWAKGRDDEFFRRGLVEGGVLEAAPISAFPVVRVDTSADVDVPALANTIRGMLPL